MRVEQIEPGPHGPTSERIMRHYYGASGYQASNDAKRESVRNELLTEILRLSRHVASMDMTRKNSILFARAVVSNISRALERDGD